MSNTILDQPTKLDKVIAGFAESNPETYQRISERMEKAKELVQRSSCIFGTDQDHIFYVRSEVMSQTKYRVDSANKTCTCPDSSRNGNPCKHRIAIWLKQTSFETTVKKMKDDLQKKREQFDQWKQANPNSANINFDIWNNYQHDALVTYNSPCHGTYKIQVRATHPYYPNGDSRPAKVQVTALSHTPFSEFYGWTFQTRVWEKLVEYIKS
ncbi:SWIM zinc finger family protein [Chloroflexota bacterium]